MTKRAAARRGRYAMYGPGRSLEFGLGVKRDCTEAVLPGVLRAYRATATDLAGYVKPERREHHGHGNDDCNDDEHDHRDGER